MIFHISIHGCDRWNGTEDKPFRSISKAAQIALPALGTLYFALSSIWGLPYGEQIVGTVTALDAFLGALLGVSAAQYKKAGGT